MEASDGLNAAVAPLTFHDFLARFRDPAAADLVRSIKAFIVSFMGRAPDADRDSASVQQFLAQTENAFRAHPLWAGASEEELESAGEGLEKYLMTKLYTRAFAPLPEDAAADAALQDKMAALQHFLRPQHLDIPAHFQNESSWLLAQKELQKMGSYKAPRDKLVCVLNACRVINNLLINVVSMAADTDAPGADDFLPVLIYVVIKANPPQLHSNLAYIQHYRAEKRLVSEAAYFFTNLVSAASFVENLDASSLSLDPGRFDELMYAAKEMLTSGAISGDASGADPLPPVPASPPSRPPLVKQTGLSDVMSSSTAAAAAAAVQYSPLFQDTGLGLVAGLSSAVPSTPSTGAATGGDTSASWSPGGPSFTPPAEGQSRSQSSTMPITTDAAPGDVQTQKPGGAEGRDGGGGEGGRGATARLCELDASGELRAEYPFLYARAGDLRVADVEVLLGNYKELVLKHLALCHRESERQRSKQAHTLAQQGRAAEGLSRGASVMDMFGSPESTASASGTREGGVGAGGREGPVAPQPQFGSRGATLSWNHNAAGGAGVARSGPGDDKAGVGAGAEAVNAAAADAAKTAAESGRSFSASYSELPQASPKEEHVFNANYAKLPQDPGERLSAPADVDRLLHGSGGEDLQGSDEASSRLPAGETQERKSEEPVESAETQEEGPTEDTSSIGDVLFEGLSITPPPIDELLVSKLQSDGAPSLLDDLTGGIPQAMNVESVEFQHTVDGAEKVDPRLTVGDTNQQAMDSLI
eukprot:jgi/Mesen1/5744/ME000291S04927